jgi:hypothetical protein
MNNDPYDSFKAGIKSDIRGLALNGFAGIGMFTLIIALVSVLGYVFYKPNHFDETTKIITAIAVIGLTILMFANNAIGNFIFMSWLFLLLTSVMLIILGFTGWFIYLIAEPHFKDFF